MLFRSILVFREERVEPRGEGEVHDRVGRVRHGVAVLERREDREARRWVARGSGGCQDCAEDRQAGFGRDDVDGDGDAAVGGAGCRGADLGRDVGRAVVEARGCAEGAEEVVVMARRDGEDVCAASDAERLHEELAGRRSCAVYQHRGGEVYRLSSGSG